MALRFSLNSGFARQITQGIIDYTRKNGPWEIEIRSGEPIEFSSWSDLKKWQGDGIIAPIYRAEEISLLEKKGIPVVSASSPALETPFPSVTFDDVAIGKMAADKTTQEWWAACTPCQEPLEDRADGEWWADMEEVFHCD